MKDVEEAMAPVPEVMESVAVPVEEETPTPAEPEPKVESKPELVDTELPIVEPAKVNATDSKDAEPVVSHEIGSSSYHCFLTSIYCHSRSILPRTNPFLRKVCHPLDPVK